MFEIIVFIGSPLIVSCLVVLFVRLLFGDNPLGRLLRVAGAIVSFLGYLYFLTYYNDYGNSMIVFGIFAFGPIVLLLLLLLLQYVFKDNANPIIDLSDTRKLQKIQFFSITIILAIVITMTYIIYDINHPAESTTIGSNIDDNNDTLNQTETTNIQNRTEDDNKGIDDTENTVIEKAIEEESTKQNYIDMEINKSTNESEVEELTEEENIDQQSNEIDFSEFSTVEAVTDKPFVIKSEYPSTIKGQYFESSGYYLDWLSNLLLFTVESSESDTVTAEVYENDKLVYSNDFLFNGDTFNFSPTLIKGNNNFKVVASTLNSEKYFEDNFTITYTPAPLELEFTSVPEIVDSDYGEYSDWSERSKVYYTVKSEIDDIVDITIIENGITHEIFGCRSGDELYYTPEYKEAINTLKFIATSQTTGETYEEEFSITYNIVNQD